MVYFYIVHSFHRAMSRRGPRGTEAVAFAGGTLPFTTARTEPCMRAALLLLCWTNKCTIISKAIIAAYSQRTSERALKGLS